MHCCICSFVVCLFLLIFLYYLQLDFICGIEMFTWSNMCIYMSFTNNRSNKELIVQLQEKNIVPDHLFYIQ